MAVTVPVEEAVNNNDNTGGVVHPSSLETLLQLHQAGLIRHDVVLDQQHQQDAWGSVVRFTVQGHLEFLDLGGCRLYRGLPDGALEIFTSSSSSSMTSLKQLNLGGTDLPIGDMMALLQPLAPTLEELHVGGNGLRDAGVERLAAEFVAMAQNLRVLDLRYNDIGPVGCRALCTAFREKQQPSSSNTNSTTTMTKLYLEGNQIQDDGAKEIAHYLETSSLQELFVGANQIGPEGATALAESLRINTILTKLYLEGNNIGAVGADAFAQVLVECNGKTALKHLFCDNNNIGKEASKRLANALNSGTAIGESLLE